MNRFLLLLLTTALLSSASLLAEQSPLIQITIDSIKRSDDNRTATALAILSNHSGVDVTNVDVDLVLKSLRPTTLSAASYPSWPADWSCQSTGAMSVRCRLPLIRGVEGAFVPLVVTIEPADEGRFVLTAQATWNVGDATFTSAPRTESALYQREVLITNTNDDGDGSLRAAIAYANDTCARDLVPCVLHFRFTEAQPEQGWYTIRPLTPLPAITALDIAIDRRPDQRYDEPQVEIDGSLLHSGNGLEFRGEGPASIAYLAIGGFPWDGIAITRRGPTGIGACSIGVHPNGQPNGNGSRGVTVDTPATDVGLGSNRISANGRSGVFIMGGERITFYPYNVIGRFRWESPLLGNGASGVFAGPNARDIVIQQTFIGGNAQMGVAIASEARGVRIDNTWIDPNGGLPIDHGLNGFSGEVGDALHFALPAPRIELATYDLATNITTIRGTFDAPDPDTSWRLTVYGSSMGEWPEADLPYVVFRGKTFTMTMGGHPDVLRATVGAAYFGDWSTSEYSLPVEVRSIGTATKTRSSRF
jgi:hypothetical protein